MKVLIACEFSGIVRAAFRARGHDAWSCDLLDAEDESPFHIVHDALGAIRRNSWDLLIAHPPCTHLAVSGARWFKDKQGEQQAALTFVRALMDATVARIAVENPISIISSRIRKPDQIIQPWQFGHKELKATCLWLKNLPKLTPTDVLNPPKRTDFDPAGWADELYQEEYRKWARVHQMPPGPDRWKARSRTLRGIADAMADQWGNL